LPNFTEVDVVDDNENKQYLIKLKDVDKKEFSSRVLSEGTLRILALCILEFDEKHTGLLCFEEPENGIHPFRIKAMTELLKDLSVDFNEVEIPRTVGNYVTEFRRYKLNSITEKVNKTRMKVKEEKEEFEDKIIENAKRRIENEKKSLVERSIYKKNEKV
jgi:hypothetical protein